MSSPRARAHALSVSHTQTTPPPLSNAAAITRASALRHDLACACAFCLSLSHTHTHTIHTHTICNALRCCTHIYVCLSACLSICLYVCLSVMSACMSVRLSVCLSIHASAVCLVRACMRVCFLPLTHTHTHTYEDTVYVVAAMTCTRDATHVTQSTCLDSRRANYHNSISTKSNKQI